MAFSTNNIVRIKDFQTYQGIEILNVYHYIANNPVGSVNYTNLLANFQAVVLDDIRATQNPNLSHVRLEADQLNGDSTFRVEAVALPGTKAGGNDAPTFVNASYLLARSDKDTRNGRKAITGLDEADFTGNALTAAAIALHATALVGVVSNLTDGVETFKPVIIGGPTGTPNQYRLNFVDGGASFVRPNLTTQNTRKS